MHYCGYQKSRQKVAVMDRRELCDLIESLYGWSWGDDGIDEEDSYTVDLERLRDHALVQHDYEWTVPANHLNHYPDAEE